MTYFLFIQRVHFLKHHPFRIPKKILILLHPNLKSLTKYIPPSKAFKFTLSTLKLSSRYPMLYNKHPGCIPDHTPETDIHKTTSESGIAIRFKWHLKYKWYRIAEE